MNKIKIFSIVLLFMLVSCFTFSPVVTKSETLKPSKTEMSDVADAPTSTVIDERPIGLLKQLNNRYFELEKEILNQANEIIRLEKIDSKFVEILIYSKLTDDKETADECLVELKKIRKFLSNMKLNLKLGEGYRDATVEVYNNEMKKHGHIDGLPDKIGVIVPEEKRKPRLDFKSDFPDMEI